MPTQRSTNAPDPDPFAGDFSQQRADGASTLPVMQWHGGLGAMVDPRRRAVAVDGGFFIEGARLEELGLDPGQAARGFEKATVRLGNKPVTGWGAPKLHIAILFSEFHWEDRETGRQRFPASEYERRRALRDGSERQLRGRTRCLVAVRELLHAGAKEPLIFSVRGSYSAAFNAVLRDLKHMADEATRLRRQAGQPGAIGRECFWLPIYAGQMEEVGEGANKSLVSLPKCDIPGDLSREYLLHQLVAEALRKSGGLFDEWARLHGEGWAQAGGEATAQGEFSEFSEPPAGVRQGEEPGEGNTFTPLSTGQQEELLALWRRLYPNQRGAPLLHLEKWFVEQLGYGLAEATEADGEAVLAALRG